MSAPYIFATDVQLNLESPGLEFNGTEPGHVYHEDREVNGVMRRATNASYSYLTGQWTQVDTTQPSYCRGRPDLRG